MPSAVISGASIAGLSAAFWLRRTGWDVTVIERAPAFRDGGQNVDVRGVAREVLTRMGLFDVVKALNTTETGTVLVDAAGNVRAELPSQGPDGATAELEVLRGDFARAILEHLPPGVEMIYGDTVSEMTGSDVTTAGGRSLRADLLVVAEGVRSATRDRLFGPAVDRRELGITMVFGTIPRTPADDDRWRWHNAVGGRQIHLRPDNHGTTRAILSYAGGDDLTRLDRPEALARVRERYADAGWEAPRILDGFDASDDVYIDQLAQIRMPAWHRGRVVLAGDAAWCVTPMGGGGASLALTSGYVLAAYLASAELPEALAAYETWMRPLVDDVQKLPPGLKHFAYPRTRLGLAARGVADRLLTSRLFAPIAARLTEVAATDRPLPEIPARPKLAQ
ncbi:FAD-dependent monooxygenase [Actinoplanes sp. RD1]|uniref:FAD-dependent monooxygenase n=1 Tax=Actinoplanes sp. RD1 TaxID=3064538 RepID=UPI00274191C1|nr:FAD-dependent monooxygenase [Actinoplanes sp. RD1]